MSTLRTVNFNPENALILKELFMKHASNMTSISKAYTIEQILEIIDECLLIGMFTTEEEIIWIINFVISAYKQLLSNLSEKLSIEDFSKSKLSTILDASSIAISVIETILMKYIQSTNDVENNIMANMKPFLEISLQQMTTISSGKLLECCSKFDTMLIAMVSRLIIFNTLFVMNLLMNLGVNLGQFIIGWINRMDHISTHYGRRLNLLAILNIMPFLGADLLQAYFGKLMEYVLPLIENFIYTKQSNANISSSSSTLTPTKPIKHESVRKDTSQNERKAELRRNDTIANIEIDVYFYEKYGQLCKTMNLTHIQMRSLLEKNGNLSIILDKIINHAQIT